MDKSFTKAAALRVQVAMVVLGWFLYSCCKSHAVGSLWPDQALWPRVMVFNCCLVGVEVLSTFSFCFKTSSLHRNISHSSILWTIFHRGLSVAFEGFTPGSCQKSPAKTSAGTLSAASHIWMMRSKSSCASCDISSTATRSYCCRQSITSMAFLYRKKAPEQVSTSASGCFARVLEAAVPWARRTAPDHHLSSTS